MAVAPVNGSTADAREEEQPTELYIVGMSCALISLFLSTMALLIQKYSAHREKDLPVWKRWRLMMGVLLNMSSEIALSPLSVYYAPLVLIAPLNGLALVINALLTHFGLICGIRERMSRWGWLATLSATAGVALVAVSGTGNISASSVRVQVADMPAILTRPQSLAITAPLAGFICMWLVVDKAKPLRCLRPRSVAVRSFLSGLAAASSGGLSISTVKLISNAFAEVSEGLWPPPNMLYILLVLLLVIAPLQLWLLNDALAASQAVLIIPLYMSGMTVLMTVLGGVMLDEFASMGNRGIILFSTGNVCVFVGVFALAITQRPHAKGGVQNADHDQRTDTYQDGFQKDPMGLQESPQATPQATPRNVGSMGPNDPCATPTTATYEMTFGRVAVARAGGHGATPLQPTRTRIVRSDVRRETR